MGAIIIAVIIVLLIVIISSVGMYFRYIPVPEIIADALFPLPRMIGIFQNEHIIFDHSEPDVMFEVQPQSWKQCSEHGKFFGRKYMAVTSGYVFYFNKYLNPKPDIDPKKHLGCQVHFLDAPDRLCGCNDDMCSADPQACSDAQWSGDVCQYSMGHPRCWVVYQLLK